MNEPPIDLVQLSIYPRSERDREKFFLAIRSFTANDLPFIRWIDAGSGRILLRGESDADLAAALDLMRNVYAISAEIGPLQVVCRAAIARVAEIDYTHKRQIGGTGEFARVKLIAMPNDAGRGFEFRLGIIGGSVPEAYIPAVEKGVRSAIGPGTIAGDPIIDIIVALIDGAFHDIDSSPLTFEIAARMATQQALEMGKLFMLEPVMRLEVVIAAADAGLVAADLKMQRSRIERQNPEGDTVTIHALTPLANLLGYGDRLDALSMGRASHSIRFDHYERLAPDDPDPPFRPAAAIR